MVIEKGNPLPELPPGVPETDRHRLANALNSVAVRLLRSLRDADEVMFLSAPQASLLSVLVFGGTQTIGGLAAREQVSSPAITKHIDNLERRGLVARRRSTTDRRVVLVEATEAGTALLHRGRAERVNQLAERLGSLEPTERELLDSALSSLRSLL